MCVFRFVVFDLMRYTSCSRCDLMNNLFVIVVVISGFFIVWWFYSCDVYEFELFGVVVLVGLGGMGVVLVVGVFNGLYFEDSDLLIYFSFVDGMMIGVVEEGVKFGVVLFFFYCSLLFNEFVDGIIYICVVVFGFVILENIGYVVMGGLEIV